MTATLVDGFGRRSDQRTIDLPASDNWQHVAIASLSDELAKRTITVTGLSKITIDPVRRVEGMIPAMAGKGRLQRGADADIVIFNPETIGDRATVAAPATPSVGIDWVLVAGQVALRDGTPDKSVLAGRPLRSGAVSQ